MNSLWRMGALALASASLAHAAQAQEFPTRPITLVVTYAAGGNIDLTARLIAPVMSANLGQQVIVENRAGAGGTIGSTYVAKARPDGYTLLMGAANVSIAAYVFKNVPYDPLKDFTPIGGIQSVPLVLVAAPRVPASNLAELKSWSANRAEGVSVGTSGAGTNNHIALEAMRAATGIGFVHIPYKGAAPAMADLLGGQVDTAIDQLNTSVPYVREKRIKALAQMGATRSPLLPDVPTLAEQGLTGVTAATWVGLFAPAGLPPQVESRLVQALAAALADPAVRKRFDELGVVRFTQDQAGFQAFVRDDLQRNREVVNKAHIVAE